MKKPLKAKHALAFQSKKNKDWQSAVSLWEEVASKWRTNRCKWKHVLN